MDKVRFSCPRCQTIMQTSAEKVGYDVACPHCAHRFRLLEPSPPADRSGAMHDITMERHGDSIGVDTTLPPSTAPVQSYAPKPEPLNTSGVAQVVSQVMPLNHGQAGRFVCPYCQTTKAPRWKSEVSQVGWIVFGVLFMTTCVFCFIGLFIRRSYQVCSHCKIRLN